MVCSVANLSILSLVVLAARHQSTLEPRRVLLLTTTGIHFQDVVLLVLATRHQSALEPHHVLLTVS